MLGSIKKFIADRTGAFAIQFALMVVPLTVCTGLAIDGGRVFLARYELSQALDAAALAVGSTSGTQTQLTTLANTYVNANFRAPHEGPIAVTLAPNASGVDIQLNGTVTINTFFMPLVGRDTVTVSAESRARRGGNSIEVALALDITGSMAQDDDAGNPKIDELKTAAKSLIDTIVALPANQPPNVQYWSRVAIAPWSNNVYVGSSLAATLRGPVTGTVDIANAWWRDGTAKTVSSATWRSGSSIAANLVTRTSTTPRRVQVGFSANPTTLANGDTIWLIVSGSNSYTTYSAQRYRVADKTTVSPWRINLQNADTGAYIAAPTTSSPTNATSATVQECIHSSCRVQVTTSAPHGLTTSDWVFISGLNNDFTSLNDAIGAPSQLASSPAPTSNTFYISGAPIGPTIDNSPVGSTAGSLGKCYDNKCSIRITLTGHGLATNDYMRIRNTQPSAWAAEMDNASTYSGDNPSNAAWQVEKIDDDTLRLVGSEGGMTGTFTANSSDYQCLAAGCAIQRYVNRDSNVVYRDITNCVSERLGDDATTSAAAGPGAYLGLVYAGDGHGSCSTSDPLMGFDDDRTDLKNKIDSLSTHGMTAGHIGVAWGWYMLSPTWRNVLPGAQAEFQQSVANTSNLSRIMIFMSDGEFNTAHCGGVISNNFPAVDDDSEDDDRNSACTVDTSPFDQAQALCTAAKNDEIRIYTIGFDVPADSDAWDFMQNCATEEDMAFLAATGAELTAAFQEIAADIQRLRLTR